MEDTSGFYKLDGGLIFGPNFVLNKDYQLRRETKEQYTYPVDGWYWFDTTEEAEVFFGIAPTVEEVPEDQNLGY